MDRFAILKNGIRLGLISQCDQVWRACCALHNKLLIHDELDKGWKDVFSIDKDGDPNLEVSFIVEQLTSHLSEMNSIKNTYYPDFFLNKHTVDVKQIVAKMPLKMFQERLMHNVFMRFKNNDVKWPKNKSDKQTDN